MAYNNLGILELTRDHVDQAIVNFERSVSLYRDQPEGHYNLGSALLAKGQLNEAITECKTALRLQPNDPDAHVVLGNALLGKDEVDEAIEEYKAWSCSERPNRATALGAPGPRASAVRQGRLAL